ncbi:MAG: MogA/MoaB family molybdenum cofactor biosynthesis protein [Magnetococcales bacterium]|nr:MogA/MoaB family molybdenum cofactor biosynthesis protein [Magnetococcales bacterium]MBF0420367.1 MogA/MoaB family molybdenum cofactor biosynthesis protein [Magnetococcales bacterium]
MEGVDWRGLTVGILTLSDSRSLVSDKSGDGLEAMVTGFGAQRIVRLVLRDELEDIAGTLRSWADEEKMDVILTTGGTGPGPRDVTPEATRMVTQRELPGLSETMRREGLQQVRSALLTRGIAAFRGQTLIINLPGSTRGAVHSLGVVADLVPHALSMAKGGGHG